ncbi:MAG TPA: hypothetical protein VI932_11765 [Bacteroidota bacterium]|nr:hypothetical protein [Bacteroidota bacterium]
MRKLARLFLLLAAQSIVFAHPGVAIVADSRGNVYYTDLNQVWCLSPAGKKTVAVRDVHTHELWIDSLDNLYGEHLWYEGDASGKWGHRVWKRTPGGTVTDIIPSRQGFRDDFDDFHFVRDRAGNMYWADEDSVTVIRKRTPGGRATDILRKVMRRAGWMTVSPGGTVYLVDGDDLIAIAPGGEARTVARGVTTDEQGRPATYDRHAVMGLWTDWEENVYLAIPERDCIKRIGPGGGTTVLDRSSSPWKPSGALIDARGDLWVLEYSPLNTVRVRQVQRNGVTRIH